MYIYLDILYIVSILYYYIYKLIKGRKLKTR